METTPGVARNAPSLKYSPSEVLIRLFQDEVAATWLLSKERYPPSSISGDIMRQAITYDGIVMPDPAQQGHIFSKREQKQEQQELGDGIMAPSSSSEPSLLKGNQSNPTNASGDQINPFGFMNKEPSSAEKIVYLMHGSTERYSLLSVSDTRIPFSFMETAGTLVPGVHRCVSEYSENGIVVTSNYWLMDGRSNISIFFFDFRPKVYVERYMLLLAPYPSYRYPSMADVLELASIVDEALCQFCVVAKGLTTCECEKGIKERMKAGPLGFLQKQDTWELWKWLHRVYESGFKRYNAVFENKANKTIVPTMVYSQLVPTFDSSLLHRHGVQTYVDVISPYLSRNVGDHFYLSSQSSPRFMHKRKRLLSDAEEIGSERNVVVRVGALNNVYPQQPVQPLQAASVPYLYPMQPHVQRLLPIASILPPSSALSMTGSPNLNMESDHIIMNVAPDQPIKIVQDEPVDMKSDIKSDVKSSLSDCGGNKDMSILADAEFKASGSTKQPASPKNTSREAIMDLLEELNRPESANIKACPICQSAFSRRHDLKRHISSVHLVEKSFVCENCDARFSRRQHLDSHRNTVHLKLSNFPCPYCDKVYTAASTRRTHLKKAHPD
mmetsp:Transcript_2154/g.3874  ORF Transcript_2154/g.3874 Transcript_2154/m.3874 type:complete len:611 (-) Transcript_2154:262-2094(-)